MVCVTACINVCMTSSRQTPEIRRQYVRTLFPQDVGWFDLHGDVDTAVLLMMSDACCLLFVCVCLAVYYIVYILKDVDDAGRLATVGVCWTCQSVLHVT